MHTQKGLDTTIPSRPLAGERSQGIVRLSARQSDLLPVMYALFGVEELSDLQHSIKSRHVRLVTPEDVPSLVALWRETWTKTYGPSLGLSTLNAMLQPLNQGVASMLPGNGERGYCLVLGTKVIGSAVVRERGQTAYLWGMYVLPEQQRAGVGSQLLAYVVQDLMLSKNIEARVLQSSTSAQEFYQACGFELVGEETTEVMASVPLPTLVLAANVDALRQSTRPSPSDPSSP